MPVEDDGQGITGEPDVQSLTRRPLQPSTYQHVPTAPTADAPSHNEPIAEKLEKDVKRGEWWLIGIGIVTLLINTFIAYIYLAQLRQMVAANQATLQAVTIASSTLTETERSNKAQELANTIAAKSASDNLRMDQRAWIQIEPIVPEPTNPSDHTYGYYRYPIRLRNTGKTFARGLVVRATAFGTISYFGRDEVARLQDHQFFEVSKPWGPFKHFFGGRELSNVPSGLSPTTATSTPFYLEASIPVTYPTRSRPDMTGEAFSYLVGRIDYTDAFAVHHWIKFCYMVVNVNGDIEYCRYGNDEDQSLQ
jgi:hypothetical protein